MSSELFTIMAYILLGFAGGVFTVFYFRPDKASIEKPLPHSHWRRVSAQTGRCFSCPIDNPPDVFVPPPGVTNPCQIDDSKPGERFQEKEGPGAQ